MAKPTYKPGDLAPRDGLYNQVDASSKKVVGTINLDKGATFPKNTNQHMYYERV